MRPAGNASGTVSRVSGQMCFAVRVMCPSEAIGGRSDSSRRMNKMNRMTTEYMTDQTRIPAFLPYPRFLLKIELTNTARVLYAMLLDRAKLSRRNGWKDEKGQIYLIYPISNMAKDLGKSQTTTKKAMQELGDAGLVKRNGRDSVCQIFFTSKSRRRSRETACPERKKKSHPESRNSVAQMGRKVSVRG